MKPGHGAFAIGGTIDLSEKDRQRLEEAFHQLEYPSFAAHLANVIGTPIEKGLKLIPPAGAPLWSEFHRGRIPQAGIGSPELMPCHE